MDLTNELKEIEDNNLPIENFIENLEEEQVKLGKKIHVLKVINISRVMAQLIKSGIDKDKILGMNLAYHQMYDKCQFSMHLFDFQEKRLKTDFQFRENAKNLVEIFKKHGKLNQDYVSESFWKDKQGKILFNKEVEQQIFDLFLNEELKKNLEYSQLSLKLKDKESGKKRPKI